MTLSVFDLPPYRMGPYTMRAKPAPREAFYDKRRIVENHWTEGYVLIHENVLPAKGLELFLRHLVTAIHYRSGLNDRSNEESFTHSLSTGLVELAQWNPLFWPRFQALLAQVLCPGADWEALAGADVTKVGPADLPDALHYDGQSVVVGVLDRATADREMVYGYFVAGEKKILLSEALEGPNLAIIGMHEALHFLHRCEGLKDSTSDKDFRRAQARILKKFLRQNPDFWRWFLFTANPMNVPMLMAA